MHEHKGQSGIDKYSNDISILQLTPHLGLFMRRERSVAAVMESDRAEARPHIVPDSREEKRRSNTSGGLFCMSIFAPVVICCPDGRE